VGYYCGKTKYPFVGEKLKEIAMKPCPQCGARIDEDAAAAGFCAECGDELESENGKKDREWSPARDDAEEDESEEE
jgi:DNA-directed RNA polymerase subunit RPC12/RpoP